MKRVFIGLIALTMTAMACVLGAPRTAPASQISPTSASPEQPSRGFWMGVAGLIPRNYPNPSASDWQDLYDHLTETGELLGAYTAWTDSPDSEGQPPKLINTAFDLSQRYGITPVIALGFFNDAPDGSLIPILDFADTGQRSRAMQTVSQVAEQYQPPYLALGVEVNRFYVQDPTGFEDYVSLYNECYQAIKAASPGTQVFPIFQYEMLRGGKFFAGDGQASPQWDLLDKFSGHMDLIGFTTYPFLLYASPTDLPEDYYTEIAKHTDLPVAFTEIGWPSEPLSNAPDSLFGGSEQEQADFVIQFFALTQSLNMKLALWSFPHDVGPDINPAFTSISMRTNDGRNKPALATWQAIVNQ